MGVAQITLNAVQISPWSILNSTVKKGSKWYIWNTFSVISARLQWTLKCYYCVPFMPGNNDFFQIWKKIGKEE